jgi:hypothetical protein
MSVTANMGLILLAAVPSGIVASMIATERLIFQWGLILEL